MYIYFLYVYYGKGRDRAQGIQHLGRKIKKARRRKKKKRRREEEEASEEDQGGRGKRKQTLHQRAKKKMTGKIMLEGRSKALGSPGVHANH